MNAQLLVILAVLIGYSKQLGLGGVGGAVFPHRGHELLPVVGPHQVVEHPIGMALISAQTALVKRLQRWVRVVQILCDIAQSYNRILGILHPLVKSNRNLLPNRFRISNGLNPRHLPLRFLLCYFAPKHFILPVF